MNFTEFLEIFETQPISIDWGNKWYQKIFASQPQNIKKGEFLIGNLKYKFYAYFNNIYKDSLLQKILRRNGYKQNLPEQWKVARIVFMLVKNVNGQEIESEKIEQLGNLKQTLQVFNTIVTAINKVISENPVEIIFFEASGRDLGRSKLYQSLINRFVKNVSYTQIPLTITNYAFVLVKNEHLDELK